MNNENLNIERVQEGHSEDYYLITFDGGSKAEVYRDWDENSGFVNSLELDGVTIKTNEILWDKFEESNIYQLMVETANFENLEPTEGVEYIY